MLLNMMYYAASKLINSALVSAEKKSTVSLFLCFNGHFPGEPGLANTRMSPFWILLELRVMEVMITTAAISCVKLQSNRHHQQNNIQFSLQFRCPSCRPTNSVKALKVRKLNTRVYLYRLVPPPSPPPTEDEAVNAVRNWLETASAIC